MCIRTSLTVVALTLASSWLPANDQAPETPKITVTGSNQIRVTPDRAILTAAIESRGVKLDSTAVENDAKVASVTKFLRDSGIRPEAIHTETLQIKPVFAPSSVKQKMQDPFSGQNAAPKSEKDSLVPTGYLVRRQLKIEVERLERFELVYRGLIERGVNEIDGIRLETSKLEILRDEARIGAIRAAKQKAELMVGELGAILEGVQSIDELNSGYARGRGNDAGPFGDPFGGPLPNGLAAGEIEIVASVRVVFRMKETELD
ncbi:MAG: SIMPL domain-containing protein [Rubripirellula sp.]